MKKNLILFLAMTAAVLGLTACNTPAAPTAQDPSAQAVKEKLYPVWKLTPQGKEWGYINEAGKQAIAPQFDSADWFTPYGSAVVGIKGKKGLVSLKGAMLLKPDFDTLTVYPGDRRVGTRDGSWTELLDRNGKVLYETGLGIVPMPEGGARIQEYVGDKAFEGYIDDAGAITIEPQFLSGTNFAEQKAVVQKAEDAYAVIDPSGRSLMDFEARAIRLPAEGSFAFQLPGKETALWGYRDLSGKVILKPSYADAQPFSAGIAVVGQKQQGVVRYGLIDAKGKFILRPKYERIEALGNGFFAVSRKAGKDAGTRSYPVAIFNGAGKRLTDYLYYEAAACTADTVSVSDGNETWVLDSAGTPMSTMPRLSGMGTIRQEGRLLVSQTDDERAYFTLAGQLVWQSPWECSLKEVIKLKQVKFRPDRGKIIYYPAVSGLADPAVQDTVNGILYRFFVGDGAASALKNGVPEAVVRVGYTGQLNKDLLVVVKSTSWIGAADGLRHENVERIHLDITDGTQYGLKDLFRADSAWSQLLADQIRSQIAVMPSAETGTLNPALVVPVLEDRRFTAGRYGLILYYDAAELGAAASEPLSFEIPYAALLKDISTEGRMWNAFLKQDM